MRKDKYKDKENNDFNELANINIKTKIQQIKDDIGKIIPIIKLVAKNDSQGNLIKSIKENEITISAGQAGCGKTYIALAYALNLIRKKENNYSKIYLVKSVTTLKSEEIGFLKGDLVEKIEPFMWSFFINLEKLISKESIKKLVDNNIIVPFPLAYMRGASLDNCIIIADEMQNVSLDNSRTLSTRIGSDSKLILIGDTNQIDMKDKENSSLNILLGLFNDVDNIGVVKMNENDINVRNPLITIIEEKFKSYYNKEGKKTERQILT